MFELLHGMVFGEVVGCLVTAVIFFLLRFNSQRRLNMALSGDVNASKHIMLPAYVPFLRGMAFGFVASAILIAVSFVQVY